MWEKGVPCSHEEAWPNDAAFRRAKSGGRVVPKFSRVRTPVKSRLRPEIGPLPPRVPAANAPPASVPFEPLRRSSLPGTMLFILPVIARTVVIADPTAPVRVLMASGRFAQIASRREMGLCLGVPFAMAAAAVLLGQRLPPKPCAQAKVLMLGTFLPRDTPNQPLVGRHVYTMVKTRTSPSIPVVTHLCSSPVSSGTVMARSPSSTEWASANRTPC